MIGNQIKIMSLHSTVSVFEILPNFEVMNKLYRMFYVLKYTDLGSVVSQLG